MMGKCGPATGNGPAQQRVLAVLRATGQTKDLAPIALRAADLAKRAKVKQGNLGIITAPLVASGDILRCEVKLPRGRPCFEYRLGSGIKAKAHTPLNTRQAGVARPEFRGARELPPIPKTLPPMASYEAIQRMNADQFGEYVKHLSRVWSWGRGQAVAA